MKSNLKKYFDSHRTRLVRTVLILLIGLVGLGITACGTLRGATSLDSVPADARESLLRVTVTRQGYLFNRPWQQQRPATQTAIGVIVAGGQVLVNGLLVADQRYIELETLDTRRKAPAEVHVVDYEANLALLRPLDPLLLEGRKPMDLAGDVAVGDLLSVWQVNPGGVVIPASGEVTSVELGAYFQDNHFLTYHLDASLPYRFNSITLPVVKGNALAGLVLRQNPSGQAVEVVATPVIRHFLEDAGEAPYRGFPMGAFHYGPTLDPQLRRYIGLPEALTGIYVRKVIRGGPADEAGLRAGDVLLRIGDFQLTNTGRYEHPRYGQTSLVHLIRTHYHVGDKVPFQVFRDGGILDLEIVLGHRRPEQFLVPPYMVDQAPEHLIVGGLVLQELSMSYLREYGTDWQANAPIHLLYYQQNQDYLDSDQREKIVIISSVIPTSYTIGFEPISNLEVLRINGQPIRNLADVPRSLRTPVDGFHRIELRQHPKLLFLDPAELPLIDEIITQRYGIPVR
ncbi:MAG: PDZ domain-containing protein [Desulfatitalea sp.]|nr:PDZ domain-containing protein [Desulfatitalea sp.]